LAAGFVIVSLLVLWQIPDMFRSQERRGIRLATEPAPGGDRRVALVVGNAAYEGASPLKNPENDARDIGELLSTLGFQTEIAVNVNRRSLEQFVDRFVNNLQPGDVGLFYFSGHGLQLSGENYLVPVDFKGQHEADVKYEAYPASQILDLMGEKRARLSIIILDACRNNPYRSLRSAGGGLAPMSGTGAFVAFAAEAGKTADDNPMGRNGLFTKHLLAFMGTSGLNLEDVFNRVRGSVYMDSGGGQTPFTYSGVIGDFYFRPSLPIVPDGRAETPTVTSPNKSDESIVNGQPASLTGIWSADDGATYFISEVGNVIWWAGLGPNGGYSFTNVFRGSRKGNSIEGDWADVPRGRGMQNGTLSVSVESHNELRKRAYTGNFSGNVWTRSENNSLSPDSGLSSTLFDSQSLTGVWSGTDQGTYFVRQAGNTIWWLGFSQDDGRTFANVFRGTMRGDSIVGEWADIPRGRFSNSGNLTIHAENGPTSRTLNCTSTGIFSGYRWRKLGPQR
jgi:hypothetical protein